MTVPDLAPDAAHGKQLPGNGGQLPSSQPRHLLQGEGEGIAEGAGVVEV